LEFFTATLCGLHACTDWKGKTKHMLVMRDRTTERIEFVAKCLEIGRRYKIMNPDRMRNTYGKLLYLIMDAISPPIKRKCQIDFSFKLPVKTVFSRLQETGCLAMLNEDRLVEATIEITQKRKITTASAFPMNFTQTEKEQAIKYLCEKYSSDMLPAEEVELIIASIADNFSFLSSSRGPVDSIIKYLKTYFSAEKPASDAVDLSIRSGERGSKLTHTHSTQFQFVLQSLTLWREIMDNFFKLWFCAEQDLLNERSGYRLCNTGQGLQRCQLCGNVSKEMQDILRKVQASVGGWIGLSVVHLGDRYLEHLSSQ
jgi:hypothetical protein